MTNVKIEIKIFLYFTARFYKNCFGMIGHPRSIDYGFFIHISEIVLFHKNLKLYLLHSNMESNEIIFEVTE
jgi:hypothetical protein